MTGRGMGSSAEKFIAASFRLCLFFWAGSLILPVAVSAQDLYQFAIERVTSARAGRDAGPYRDLVAPGLRARHDVHLRDSEFTSRNALILAQNSREIMGPLEHQQKEALKAQKEAQRRQRIAAEFQMMLAKARAQ